MTDPAVIADAIAVISARHVSAVLAAGRGSALYLDPFTDTLVWAPAVDAAAVAVIATHADVTRVLAALQAERRGDADLLEPDDVARAVAADARRRLGVEEEPVAELLDAVTSQRLADEIDEAVARLLERGVEPLQALHLAYEEVEARQRAFEAEVEAELARLDAASEVTVALITAARAGAIRDVAVMDAASVRHRAELGPREAAKLDEDGEPTEAAIEAAVARMRAEAEFVVAAMNEAHGGAVARTP